MRLDFAPQVVRDLGEILDFVARHNPRAAVDSLEASCQGLTEMPQAGTRREDLAPGLRAFSHGSYIIYFVRQTERLIRIVRIMHGARHVQPADFRPRQG